MSILPDTYISIASNIYEKNSSYFIMNRRQRRPILELNQSQFQFSTTILYIIKLYIEILYRELIEMHCMHRNILYVHYTLMTTL